MNNLDEIKALLEADRIKKEPYIKQSTMKIGKIITKKNYTLEGKKGCYHCKQALTNLNKYIQRFSKEEIRQAVVSTIQETGYIDEEWTLRNMLRNVISKYWDTDDIKIVDTIQKPNNITFKFSHATKKELLT